MRGQRAQAAVEFGLTVGLLMLVVVMTTQVAIYLHYRTTLDLVTREGAYAGSLVNTGPADAMRTSRQLWAEIEPGGGPIQVTATRDGNLMVVTASVSAPALVPAPVPPFAAWPVTSRSVHTIEVFTP